MNFKDVKNLYNEKDELQNSPIEEVSKYDLVVNYYRSLGLDPYKLRGTVGKVLRDKIKDSPAFLAWAKLNSSFEHDSKYGSIIQELKAEKKVSAKSGKFPVTFLNYPDKNSKTVSDSDKEIAKTDDKYITPS